MADPAVVQTNIDRAKFETMLRLTALRCNAKDLSILIPPLKKQRRLVNIPRVKAVVPDPQGSDSKRLLLLHQDIPQDLSPLPEDLSVRVREVAEVVPYQLKMTYSMYTMEGALQRLLPPEVTIPSSFETVGHIAHMNLRDELWPYRFVIGQVLLDKVPNIKTVVTKVGKIDNKFRVFNMEVIAGEREFETLVKEQTCQFHLDYSKVYWNSRLQTEHERAVAQFNAGDIVGDMFAGIGPFAVPAAKLRKCVVYANDLNPDSFHWLNVNVRKNKVHSLVSTYNLDGRDFIRKMHAEQAKGACPYFTHVMMNLPAIALEFLDVFRGLFDAHERQLGGFCLPTIHCYCFSAEQDFKNDIRMRVNAALGQVQDLQVRFVRNVAPKKDMYCVNFALPERLAFPSEEEHKTSPPAVSSSTDAVPPPESLLGTHNREHEPTDTSKGGSSSSKRVKT